jgi:hypothetical protein
MTLRVTHNCRFRPPSGPPESTLGGQQIADDRRKNGAAAKVKLRALVAVRLLQLARERSAITVANKHGVPRRKVRVHGRIAANDAVTLAVAAGGTSPVAGR